MGYVNGEVETKASQANIAGIASSFPEIACIQTLCYEKICSLY